MPFLIKDDLKTHLYPEIIDQISRTDNNIIERCISSAVAEVKAYLNKYDLVKLFGTDIIPKTVESEHLNNLVKDCACWMLVRLANPNVNLELFKMAYDDAIKFLDKVQKGQVDPDGWPTKEDNPNTDGDEGNGSVGWSSNIKRKQFI